MDYSISQIIAAVLMLVAAAALVLAWRRYQSRSAERRRLAMLEALGIDPAIASSADLAAVMDDVRHRCERCQSEGQCERWLRGEELGGNEFCPNAQVFEALRNYSPTAS